MGVDELCGTLRDGKEEIPPALCVDPNSECRLDGYGMAGMKRCQCKQSFSMIHTQETGNMCGEA